MRGVEAALLILLSFLALFSLSLVVTLNAMGIYLSIAILLYASSGPLLSPAGGAANGVRYFVLLPIPYTGLWLISLIFFSSLNIPYLLAACLASAIPSLMVTSLHISSRMRNLLFKRPLSEQARVFFIEIALTLPFIGLILLSVKPPELEPANKVIFYGVLSVFYCLSSLTFVNATYRSRRLCKMLGAKSVRGAVEPLLMRIEEKFPDRREDVELLRHYYFEAVRLFVQGNYEMAFFSAYKIIREKTVVDPTKYISDKRDGDPPSFSIIRAMLLHSRVKDARINPKEVMRIKAKLPQFTLEMIQRATMLIEKLAT